MSTTPPPAIVVDCSAFERAADGSWQTMRATTVTFGGSSIELKEGKLTRNSGIRINGVSLVEYLDQHCKKP